MNIITFFKRAFWWSVRKVRGNRYRHLFDEIEEIKPKHIVEIGTWNAINAIKMIQAASKFHASDQIHYYGFDLFEDMTEKLYAKEVSRRPPSMQEVTAKLKATGANIHLYKGNTNDTLPQILPSIKEIDLIFIDGGHSIDTIANDWECISSHISRDTVVIFDDYWSDRIDAGAKPVIDNIDPSAYEVTVLPITDHHLGGDAGKRAIQFARVIKK